MYGGFKIGRSLDCLPLQVSVAPAALSEGLQVALETRAWLLYTGKQRLAKNTLICALRRFSLTPLRKAEENFAFDNIISNLANGAEDFFAALRNDSNEDPNDVLDKLGSSLNR